MALLLLFFCHEFETCAAFRLVEFELRPTTTSTFTCTEDIARDIEMAAETCLLNQCKEYITEISFSYSNCTTENTISISGGVSVVNEGTIVYDPVLTDTCVNNILESDVCKEFFIVAIPNLSSMGFASDYVPETSVPTKAPTTSSPTKSPTTSSPFSTPTGGTPIMTSLQPIPTTKIPSSPFPTTTSSQPTVAPSIQLSSKPSTNALAIPSKSPEMLVSGVTRAPNSSEKSKSNKNTVAIGAVFALTGLTIVLLGYLLVSTLKKRQNGSKTSTDRGPLDTTDTAFDNDEDPELGNRLAVQRLNPLSNVLTETSSKNTTTPLESYNSSIRTTEFEGGNVDIYDNNDSLILEDDELSSGSSTLFDVNGRNGYDDAASSVFYESQGEEDDEEDGTEIELDGTWGPDESSLVSDTLKGGEEDEESLVGSTISSLGASGVENFGENPSPQQFMEWIKKSPLIPAAAKASIVAAAVAEVAATEDGNPATSSVTLPLNFSSTVNSDASGRQSW